MLLNIEKPGNKTTRISTINYSGKTIIQLKFSAILLS